MAHSLVVLTGASRSGKTTIARHFQQHHSTTHEVVFFDSIGVPPVEQIERQHGSGTAWQRAMTRAWMSRIGGILDSGRPVLFEGQMRIAFIYEALAEAGIAGARVVLADCDDGTRQLRLQRERNQPELAGATMMTWASYPREEARNTGTEILDTGLLSVAGA